MIEGLTSYRIDKARKHAATHGPGTYIASPKISRVRLSKGKIQHFIEFISAPCYLQSVGFGSKHLKLSSGIEVKMPKVIRTMIASRLISAYSCYCQDNEITPPCKSTLYKIIKACAASQLTSLKGLDNHTNEGIIAIDTLNKVVEKMREHGLTDTKAMDIKKQLDALKIHLKHDFRGHLSEKSSCIQHCINYALAERTCSDHEHTESCSSCELAYTISDQIPEVLNTLHNIDETIKEELHYDLNHHRKR